MDELRNSDLVIAEERRSVSRWLPMAVVVGTMAGFIGLAWYAYHAGSEAVKEDDLLVVEADKAPIREKPLNPGGMQFPNQDKTIFDTFSNGAATPPKVERVLPPPEEPAPAGLDTSGTGTWINDNLHKHGDKTAAPAKTEAVIAPAKPIEEKPKAPEAQKTETKLAANDNPAPALAPTAPVPAPAEVKPAAPQADTTVAKPKPAPAPAPAKPEAKAAASDKGVKVQLGAYRSEEEARTAWAKMQKQHDELAGHTPLIVKADLGSRGVYYRLRLGGFGSNAEATDFCATLSAGGQPCIIATGR
ncbi:MAG: SPOR domain-containing protein [Pseudomonadota bacterium]|nr:SPOR domain-containing protein [Pseudomonadota bacterium]